MWGGIFEKNKIKDKVKKFDEEISNPNFWKDKLTARKILKEKNFFENILENFNSVTNELENLEQLLEIASKENDLAVLKDCEKKTNLLLNQIKKIEVSCFLSDENDHLDTYLEIHAGAGGTESQDWAQMLRRMYSKWIEKKKATCPYCRTTIQFYKHNKQMTRIICIDNTIEPVIEPQRNRNINLITVDRRIYSFLKFGTIVSGLLASINIYFLIK